MGRPARLDIEGGWHHVMNRGAGRRTVFHSRADGELFLDLLAHQSRRLGIEIHADCLMPNHFHLVVHCPTAGLSHFMQRLGSSYTKRSNARRGLDGPVFRSRFRSLVLDSPRYIAVAGRYVHRNPSELRAVADVTLYRWSSLRFYAGLDTPPDWLVLDRLLGDVGGTPAAYRDFVDGGNDVAPDPAALLGFISMLVDERGGDGTMARRLAVAALDRCDDCVRHRLTALLDLPSQAALLTARTSIRPVVERDPTLRRLLDAAFRLAA
jgi:REP element-mobilizing transposase RayT